MCPCGVAFCCESGEWFEDGLVCDCAGAGDIERDREDISSGIEFDDFAELCLVGGVDVDEGAVLRDQQASGGGCCCVEDDFESDGIAYA